MKWANQLNQTQNQLRQINGNKILIKFFVWTKPSPPSSNVIVSSSMGLQLSYCMLINPYQGPK